MTTKSKNILLSAVCAIGVTATAAGVAYASGKTANAESSAITGATLTLGSSISLRYYANASESGDIGTLTMRFTQNGKQSEPVQAQASGENRVYFDYEVAPQFMGDTVTAQLFGGETMLGVKEYSVAEYCKAKIADENADVDLKTLCADILAYGAASQMYTEHNTESLVNAGYGDSATEFEEIEDTDYSLTGEIDEKTAFTAGNCYFDGTNRILFYFNTDDFAALTIALKKDGKSIEYDTRCETEGKYVISADVYALDFNAVYTASITKGEAVQTAMYSLKSYAYYWQNNMAEDGETFSPMADLARALWNYGESSKAWYYTPVISETEETVTVKAGEAYQFPQLTATNRAGETLAVKPCVNGEETESDSAVFYEDGTIRYVAESHGQIATVDVNVNVDYEGVNLADAHYLDTAADRFYGIYGATFYNVDGTQNIGRFTGKQIHDERVDVGVYGTSFVGSMSFNLRGGSKTAFGLYVKVERMGGGRIKLCNGSSELLNTDNTIAGSSGNDGTFETVLKNPFRLGMKATDIEDESGNITAVKVEIWLNGESITGENGYVIDVTEDNKTTLCSDGWFFIQGEAVKSYMTSNSYVHSIYLNTPDYASNLLLSGWSTVNSEDVVTGVTNENGMQYAAVKDGNNKNIYTDYGRNYTDYGWYDGVKFTNQKLKITAKAAFKAGDDFCVYLGRNSANSNYRWLLRGLFVSFGADNGVTIGLGEATKNYHTYANYNNATIQSLCEGKNISELFAEGITLEMQVTDIKDADGNAIAVNVRIWINGIAINSEGYRAEKLSNWSSTEGGVTVTGDVIFKESNLIFGGAISDTEGYISGVYLED